MRLISIIGLVVIIVTSFAAGFYLSTAIKDPGVAVTALVGIVSIYSSFLVAVATVVLVVEAQKTREAQTAPDISVSFTQPNRAGRVYIVIKNDGAGTAKHIKFSVCGDIWTYYGRPLAETSYISQGIGYLVPGQQIRSLFTEKQVLTQQPSDAQVFTISAEYKSESGKQYRKEFFNDFSILLHMSRTDQPVEKISTELAQLRKVVDKIADKIVNG